MVRGVESTSSISDGCGLLYRPTSMNAVTSPPEGFLIRKEVLFPRRLRQPLDTERPETVRARQISLAIRRAGRKNIEGHNLCVKADGAGSPHCIQVIAPFPGSHRGPEALC